MIRRLQPGDEAVLTDAVRRFWSDQPLNTSHLDDPSTVVLIAQVDDEIAGWAHGYEINRIDGGSMMLLYEVDVGERHLELGIWRSLVQQMAVEAIGDGCRSMWVVTDADNGPALSLYAAGGGERVGDHAMFEWRFEA